MLSIKNLRFSYNEKKQFTFPDFEIGQSEHWLLLGQSGCGKSTLLHLIGGLLTPEKGEIYIAKTNMATLKESARDKFRGQHVGIVFQQSHLIKSLTVEENLLAAQYLAGNEQTSKEVAALLKRLGLEDKLKSRPHKLSQGEQQRVSIARALVNKPSLILADEPTSSLDDVNCRQVVELLLEESKANKASLIIVTHDSRLKDMFQNRIELTSIY